MNAAPSDDFPESGVRAYIQTPQGTEVFDVELPQEYRATEILRLLPNASQEAIDYLFRERERFIVEAIRKRHADLYGIPYQPLEVPAQQSRWKSNARAATGVGRPPSKQVDQRADFAKQYLEKNPGARWAEIFDDYIFAYPTDQNVGINDLRTALRRRYPKFCAAKRAK